MDTGAHDLIESFVRDACGDIPVAFTTPARDEKARQIWLIVVGLAPNLSVRNDVKHPLEIHRRYLVCATSPDESERASIVESVLFSALRARSGITLESEPPADTLWLALGLPPQAACILRVPVLSERPVASAPKVETVQIDLTPFSGRRGQSAPTRDSS